MTTLTQFSPKAQKNHSEYLENLLARYDENPNLLDGLTTLVPEFLFIDDEGNYFFEILDDEWECISYEVECYGESDPLFGEHKIKTIKESFLEFFKEKVFDLSRQYDLNLRTSAGIKCKYEEQALGNESTWYKLTSDKELFFSR